MSIFDIDLIRRVAAENRRKYGVANDKSVLGKVISLRPEYRNNIRELIETVKAVVSEVNQLSIDELNSIPPLDIGRPRVKHEYVLPPLPNAVMGRVFTRFAPNPDFVLHLGSLRPLIFSYEYAKMYKGRFYLRFEDTDPKTKRPEPEFYELILRDIEWLGIKPDKVIYQSDRLELYYDVARELIRKGYAYVCTCDRDTFKSYISMGRACPHREQDIEENLELFERMLNGYFEEGEAVLRIKTDLNHPNISVRDWPALRIIDTDKYPHPRKGSKYRVWPLYNFSCSIDDHYLNISHVLRGAEHRVNEVKQEYIFRYMGWDIPTYIHHGRVAIPEGILSKSKILKGIRDGIYTGIDDPRLATIAALRRRGFTAEALYNVILKTGLSMANTTIDYSMLASENKRFIDGISNRYFGVRKSRELLVEVPDTIEVSIRRHPDYPDRGFRKYTFDSGVLKLYIDIEDFDRVYHDGNRFRLISIGNFEYRDGKAIYLGNDVSWAKRNRIPFIHWVYPPKSFKALFIYPEGYREGYIEDYIGLEDVDSHIQLERLGYFKIEKMSDKYVEVIFSHR